MIEVVFLIFKIAFKNQEMKMNQRKRRKEKVKNFQFIKKRRVAYRHEKIFNLVKDKTFKRIRCHF